MTSKDTKTPPRHPDADRDSRLNPDGTLSPFSIAEQWQQIDDWHRFLEDDKASDYPVLDGLNYAWEQVEPDYRVAGKSVIERGQDLRKVSETPLATLFYFIEMGMYPPPELLLALNDCWITYTANGGSISLEEAFIGKPKKGAGNYASRKRARFRKMKIQWDFAGFLGQGATRTQAAEALSQLLGGKPDADSILRMCRGVGPMNFSRDKKAEK